MCPAPSQSRLAQINTTTSQTRCVDQHDDISRLSTRRHLHSNTQSAPYLLQQGYHHKKPGCWAVLTGPGQANTSPTTCFPKHKKPLIPKRTLPWCFTPYPWKKNYNCVTCLPQPPQCSPRPGFANFLAPQCSSEISQAYMICQAQAQLATHRGGY